MGDGRLTVKNLTEDNVYVLMTLCLGYAKISIEYAKEENKNSLWYSHMLRVDDVLNANPKKAKSEQSISYIGSKITDAARLIGKSRRTIQRHIATGKLSVSHTDATAKSIETSENQQNKLSLLQKINMNINPIYHIKKAGMKMENFVKGFLYHIENMSP